MRHCRRMLLLLSLSALAAVLISRSDSLPSARVEAQGDAAQAPAVRSLKRARLSADGPWYVLPGSADRSRRTSAVPLQA